MCKKMLHLGRYPIAYHNPLAYAGARVGTRETCAASTGTTIACLNGSKHGLETMAEKQGEAAAGFGL
ncbi:hypothetical protein SY88_10920 [Clostridiales bacterium PH28_bin88]|nr:hypothetical protein SY88_10920 [Clostridiales bacterium PH28_bin88]